MNLPLWLKLPAYFVALSVASFAHRLTAAVLADLWGEILREWLGNRRA